MAAWKPELDEAIDRFFETEAADRFTAEYMDARIEAQQQTAARELEEAFAIAAAEARAQVAAEQALPVKIRAQIADSDRRLAELTQEEADAYRKRRAYYEKEK
jgi:hypothetical protein